MTSQHPSSNVDSIDSVSGILGALRPKWRRIAAISVGTAVLAYGVALIIPPTYTARTTFISPQQQQNSAAAALSSLGALSGLAGVTSGIKSPADQYASLLQSVTINNRIIDRFDLMKEFESKYKEDARKRLNGLVRISIGKKDNLISIDVDDRDPERAMKMANAYVEELRSLTNSLALSEAQQRRVFFEQQLAQTKEALAKAQAAVQKSGFSEGALKSEPKAAAEAYARVKVEIAAAEVRLATLRKTLTDASPDVQRTQATLSGLRAQLAEYERPAQTLGSQDYVSAYREFKYQEALFEVYAKQFELAKMDEARDGTIIQVLDPALKPERRSKPKRLFLAAAAMAIAALLSSAYFLVVAQRGRRERA